MKTCFVYAFIGLIASLCLCFCAEASNTIDRFATKYKKARTEIQKRNICLSLIDAGLLYEGSPIADMKKVFQKDFLDQGMDDKTNRRAIVYFVAPNRSGGPEVSPFLQGWYLSIIYRDIDGSVVDYCMSKEHKATSMRLQLERQQRVKGTNMDLGLPAPELPKNN